MQNPPLKELKETSDAMALKMPKALLGDKENHNLKVALLNEYAWLRVVQRGQ